MYRFARVVPSRTSRIEIASTNAAARVCWTVAKGLSAETTFILLAITAQA